MEELSRSSASAWLLRADTENNSLIKS